MSSGSDDLDPDRTFVDPAGFSGYQLRQVRAYLKEALQDAGLEVTEYPDRLESADGRVFGLHTAMARCANAPAVMWRQIVSDQVRSLLAACRPELLDTLDLGNAVDRVFPRVIDIRSAGSHLRPVLSYARPVSGDLVEILVLETDLTVMWLRDTDVARIGEAGLRALAYENLLRVLALRRPRERSIALQHDALVHVLEGGGHTASQVLVLPQVLPKLFPRKEFPHGLLVAIPTKYEIWLHPIRDYRAYAAYVGLHAEAVRAYAHDPGSLSPYVYWWRSGELVQIMSERDGLPEPDELFLKTVARVAEADEAKALELLAELGRPLPR